MFDPSFFYEPSDTMVLLAAIVSLLVSLPLAVGVYVANGLAYMRICKKTGVQNGYLAFIPVANLYLLGKIAEKSDAAAYPEKTPRRWSRRLLVLSIALLALIPALLVFLAICIGLGAYMKSDFAGAFALGGILNVYVVVVVLSVILTVNEYMALYRLYRLMSPSNAVWMTLLSVFVSPASTVILCILGFGKAQPALPAALPPTEAPTEASAENE